MNKAQLVTRLASQIGTSKKTAHAAVDSMIDIIITSIKEGESVTLSGFGVFELRKRAPRTARNPQTGESLIIDATSVPYFRPGTSFKEFVSGGTVITPKNKIPHQHAKKSSNKKVSGVAKAANEDTKKRDKDKKKKDKKKSK